MADFGGFNIETPQEVLQRLTEQRQRALSSPRQADRIMARNSQLFDDVFGNDKSRLQEKRIKDVATAVDAAVKGLPENATANERAAARLKAAQGVIEQFDPAEAMKIETQLLQLDDEAFQRRRLVASDAREVEEHDQATRLRELKIGELENDIELDKRVEGMRAVVTGALGDKPQTTFFDLNDPDSLADFEAFMAENPDGLPVDPSDVLDLVGSDGKRTTSLPELRELRKAADTQIDAITFTNRMLEVYQELPEGRTLATAAGGVLNELALQAEAAGRALRDVASADGGAGENQSRVNAALEKRNIVDRRLQALTLNLAYSLARSLDPGGRLSDPDIERAVEMITGGANMRANIQVLRDGVGLKTQLTMERLARSNDVDLVAKHMARLQMGLDEFNTRATSLFPEPDRPAPGFTPPDERPEPTGPEAFTTSTGARVGGKL